MKKQRALVFPPNTSLKDAIARYGGNAVGASRDPRQQAPFDDGDLPVSDDRGAFVPGRGYRPPTDGGDLSDDANPDGPTPGIDAGSSGATFVPRLGFRPGHGIFDDEDSDVHDRSDSGRFGGDVSEVDGQMQTDPRRRGGTPKPPPSGPPTPPPKPGTFSNDPSDTERYIVSPKDIEDYKAAMKQYWRDMEAWQAVQQAELEKWKRELEKQPPSKPPPQEAPPPPPKDPTANPNPDDSGNRSPIGPRTRARVARTTLPNPEGTGPGGPVGPWSRDRAGRALPNPDGSGPVGPIGPWSRNRRGSRATRSGDILPNPDDPNSPSGPRG